MAAAEFQAPRIAAVRGLSLEQVRQLIDDNTEGRTLGFLGEQHVNVLELNIALDAGGMSTVTRRRGRSVVVGARPSRSAIDTLGDVPAAGEDGSSRSSALRPTPRSAGLTEASLERSPRERRFDATAEMVDTRLARLHGSVARGDDGTATPRRAESAAGGSSPGAGAISAPGAR